MIDLRLTRSEARLEGGDMDKDAQALLLLTNRILLDYLSIKVSEGTYAREAVEKLISFSEAEVVKGAPWLESEIRQFADLFRNRLAPGSQDDA